MIFALNWQWRTTGFACSPIQFMYHYLACDQVVNKKNYDSLPINDIANSPENFHDSFSEPIKYKSVTFIVLWVMTGSRP
jgi:hypothetical protein